MRKKDTKSNNNTLPRDPLERCHLRWHCLFWGVWKAVCKRDKNLRWGLLEALKEHGLNLLEGSVPGLDPFKANPSDEVLRKALTFKKQATIPNLRGRRPPISLLRQEIGGEMQWIALNPIDALMYYSHVLWILKDLPKHYRARCKWLKEHLPEILSPIQPTARKEISDDDLEDLVIGPGKKTVAVNVTAYLHKMEPEAFCRYLKQARSQFPEMAKSLKHGMHLIPSGKSPAKGRLLTQFPSST